MVYFGWLPEIRWEEPRQDCQDKGILYILVAGSLLHATFNPEPSLGVSVCLLVDPYVQPPLIKSSADFWTTTDDGFDFWHEWITSMDQRCLGCDLIHSMYVQVVLLLDV